MEVIMVVKAVFGQDIKREVLRRISSQFVVDSKHNDKDVLGCKKALRHIKEKGWDFHLLFYQVSVYSHASG